jgi:hypothetical protein
MGKRWWVVPLVIVLVVFLYLVFLAFGGISGVGDNISCELYEISDDPCLAKGKTCGMCSMLISWVEYDSERNVCVWRDGGGCEAVTPGMRYEECESKCILPDEERQKCMDNLGSIYGENCSRRSIKIKFRDGIDDQRISGFGRNHGLVKWGDVGFDQSTRNYRSVNKEDPEISFQRACIALEDERVESLEFYC